MKLTFTPPNDNHVHIYCCFCKNETIREYPHHGGLRYTCKSCGNAHSRALIIDPKVVWWCAQDGEYWHESAGIFLADHTGKFLFLERTQHPFGLTVPAGHVDNRETPLATARRELGEEAGVHLKRDGFRPVGIDDIYGDECRRGSDVHRWHTFFARLSPHTSVNIDRREASKALWLHLPQALSYNLTPATRYIIERHGNSIHRMTL